MQLVSRLPPRPAAAALGLRLVAAELVVFGVLFLWVPSGGLAVALCGAVLVAITLLVTRGAARRAAESSGRLVDALAPLGENRSAVRVSLGERAEFEPIARAIDTALDHTRSRLARLENQNEEQQAIFESMSNGLLAIDSDHRLLRVNRAAASILGVDAEKARGRLVQEITRQPGLNRFVREAMTREEPTEGEFEVYREGSSQLVVQARSEPLRDAGDRPAGLLVLLSDITKLRRLESLRADFAANVSHELRTPITNIKGYVDTLLEVGVEDREQTSRFLEIIRRNTRRLGSIIEDLLALSRLEQAGDRETLEPEDAPILPIVESVKANLESAAEAKSISLQILVPPTLEAHVLPSLVEQALANLVANAITYSPPSTVVTIAAAERPKRGEDADAMIEISVQDRGPGIPAHHLSRVFERFYRIDRARSREQGGTGLGLAIVKHIALAHGGRVEVDSRVGAGSTFRLILPRATQSTPAPP